MNKKVLSCGSAGVSLVTAGVIFLKPTDQAQ